MQTSACCELVAIEARKRFSKLTELSRFMKTDIPPTFRFFDLAGKTLVVTGTTRGIGRALLPGFLAQGLNLVLISRELAEMEQIRNENGCDEKRMLLFECDLADPAQILSVGGQILARVPLIDAILHNAAIDPRLSFAETDDEFWHRVFQINVMSAVSLTRLLLPRLRNSAGGRVLFTGSVMETLGGANLTSYASSKGAISGITRSLAHELKATGITVNCIVPGIIQVEKESADPALDERFISWQSVERRLTPTDLHGLVCLLLSQAGSGITGQSVTVDGGLIHPLAASPLQATILQQRKSHGEPTGSAN